MNVEEYLEATNGTTSGGVTQQKSSTDSTDASDLEDNLSLNDPDDIQKNLARFAEIDSTCLHGEFSDRLGVEYLSVVKDEGVGGSGGLIQKQLTGKIVEPNNRFIVDVPCRRETPCPPGVNLEELMVPSFRHVFFVVDTSSPHSYLSVEAMQAISSTKCGDSDNFSTCTIPDFIDVELRSGSKVEFHLSPGSNSEVNILGGSVLRLADLTTHVREKEFILSFLD